MKWRLEFVFHFAIDDGCLVFFLFVFIFFFSFILRAEKKPTEERERERASKTPLTIH